MRPWQDPPTGAVLIGYDCPSNRDGETRRRRLRRLCRPRLERVQYSVYLGHMPRSELPHFEQDLLAAIATELDRLLVADLGAGTWHSHGLGMPAVRLPPAALAVVADSHAALAGAARAAVQDCQTPRPKPEPAETGPCESLGRQLDGMARTLGFLDWLASTTSRGR